MSARATAVVWARYPDGGGAMLLALALADQATDAGEYIALDVERLAKKTRQTERTVRDQLRAMAEAGWLLQMDGSKAFRICPDWMGGAPASAKAAEEGAKVVRRRGTRLPLDWTLPDEWCAWAIKEFPAWTTEWVVQVAARFKDHWLAASGQTASKVEWEGTWRNWCRKEPAVPPVPQPGQQGAAWWESSAAIDRKGAELGLTRIDGELWMQWRDRVFMKAGEGPWRKKIYRAPDPQGETGGFKNIASEIQKRKGIVGGASAERRRGIRLQPGRPD